MRCRTTQAATDDMQFLVCPVHRPFVRQWIFTRDRPWTQPLEEEGQPAFCALCAIRFIAYISYRWTASWLHLVTSLILTGMMLSSRGRNWTQQAKNNETNEKWRPLKKISRGGWLKIFYQGTILDHGPRSYTNGQLAGYILVNMSWRTRQTQTDGITMFKSSFRSGS